jgi:hypothetical protein
MRNTRRLLAATLAVLPAIAVLAGCARDEAIDAGGDDSGQDAFEHPTGASDAIVRIEQGGGFVPEGYDFATPPQLVITGDGRVIQPGPVPAIYPGPALTPLLQRSITEAGIQKVLEALDSAGLLSPPPSYEPDPAGPQVADASTVTLVVTADGTTYTHTAYALGIEGMDTTPARRALAAAVSALSDLPTLVGGDLGPEQTYAADSIGVLARPGTPEDTAEVDGLTPEVVTWPEAAGDLAVATTCLVADATTLPDVEGWTATTRFTQGDATYAAWFRSVLPGDRVCPAP